LSNDTTETVVLNAVNEEVLFMNRKFFLFLAIAGIGCALLGCGREAYLAEANKAVVLQAAEAINNHEYDALDQFFAQYYKRHSQATPEVKVETLTEFIDMLKYWMQAFPDGKQGIDMLIAEGSLVAFYGTFSGTHTAPMGDIPPTGRRMDSETIGFHRVENGKIVETWVTWDNLAIFSQLGLSPSPIPETEEEPEGQPGG
jgi:predicted ester cyclase